MITVSVPGKVHLMGEHAVVYGYPAVLSAINKRLSVGVKKMNQAARDTIVSTEPADYIRHAIDSVRRVYPEYANEHFHVQVTSAIPAGYHLGSSAAIAVATVGAVIYSLKHVWNPQAINQLAYEVEKKQHGNPSGGDNTAVTFGGFLWYRRELEFLKSIWQLPFTFSEKLNHFYLVDTGRPQETTGEMVAFVRARVNSQKLKFTKLFTQNEQQVRTIAEGLKNADQKALIGALVAGEKSLEGMGVVSHRVLPFIRAVEKIGGSAKILGGGGRAAGVGFLLCYHPEKETIYTVARAFKYPIFPVELGAEGIRLEEKV